NQNYYEQERYFFGKTSSKFTIFV
ncbi:MAG: Unknown protein, partial [uncultured Aureispira sp.]